MSSTSIIPAQSSAPAPMELFTVEKIHPDNITREQAIIRAMALDNKEYKSLLKRRASLHKQLERVGFFSAWNRYQKLKQLQTEDENEFHRLLREKPEGWRDDALYLKLMNQPTKEALSRLKWSIRPHLPTAKLFYKIDTMMNVFAEARDRKKQFAAENQKHMEEAKIYHDLIISKFRSLKLCHYAYYRDGELRKEAPQIQDVWITANTIYFKLFTTYKTYFGWKAMLPYNVKLQDLLSPETLFELEGATGRQIRAIYPETGKENIHGYWLALNRNDTPNGILTKVAYSEVMRWYPEEHKNRVTVPLGVGEGNKIKFVNFNDYPHWLVAGSTGTGKSNLINMIICTLISQYIPAEVRLVLVDLKGGVELSGFKTIPHLAGEVVESVEALAEQLSSLEAEMANRFAALKRVGAKDLYTHNLRSDTSLPRIIVIIDEFASTVEQGDLTRRVHNSILQLTSKGRAVGINIVVCTQDPRVDIVPGKIKANCVVRIAGRTASTENSRIIIGSVEAARIANVPGRMLLKIEQLPIEVQTPLIMESDIVGAIEAAVGAGDAPPMALPEPEKAENRWTVEKVIEIVILHLGGHISAAKVFEELKDSGVSRDQVRSIVERIYEMESVNFRGVEFRIKKIKNQRHFIASNETEEAA